MNRLLVFFITMMLSAYATAKGSCPPPNEDLTCQDGQWSVQDKRVHTAQIKRAYKVEPLEVKTQADNKISMTAILTYEDGTRAMCQYLMRWQQVVLKDRAGVQFLPESENCVPK